MVKHIFVPIEHKEGMRYERQSLAAVAVIFKDFHVMYCAQYTSIYQIVVMTGKQVCICGNVVKRRC